MPIFSCGFCFRWKCSSWTPRMNWTTSWRQSMNVVDIESTFFHVGTLSNCGLRYVKSVAASQECPNHPTERIQTSLFRMWPAGEIIGLYMIATIDSHNHPIIASKHPTHIHCKYNQTVTYLAAQGCQKMSLTPLVVRRRTKLMSFSWIHWMSSSGSSIIIGRTSTRLSNSSSSVSTIVKLTRA